MAILSNLIDNGCERVLGTLYCDNLDIGTSLTTPVLNANTITTSDSVNFGTNKANAVINLTGRKAISGTDNWLRLNDSSQFSEGVNIKGKVVNIDNHLKVGSAFDVTTSKVTSNVQTVFNAITSVNANLSVKSMNSPSGIFDNLYVLDTLKATTYSLDSVQTVNGSLYISPTLIFTDKATVTISSISGTSVQMRIVDSSTITKDNAGGHVWSQYSKVKLTGRFGDVTIGTCTGQLTTKMNTTSGAMDIKFDCDEASKLSVKTYSASEVHDLRVMIYEVGYSANDTRPVGVFITGYGNSQNSSYIDIYQGTDSRTKPRVRLGNLSGLDNSCAIAGIAPSGYGLYSDSAWLKATIYSNAGQIGGWTIGTNSLVNGTIGADNSLFLYSNGTSASANIAGSGAITDWRITAGSHFGVTKNGALYCNSGKIAGWTISTSAIYSGTNSITSTTAGLFLGTNGIRNYKDANTYVNITNGVITARAVDLSGKIIATSGSIGTINISSTALYSGSKTTYNSANAGIYFDKDGKMGIGSSSEYITFNGTHLDAKVNSLNIAGVRAATTTDIDNIAVGGRNLLSDTDAPSLTKVAFTNDRYFSSGSVTNVVPSFVTATNPPVNVKYATKYVTSGNNGNARCLCWYNGNVAKMIDGETYTVSVYARVTNGTTMRIYFSYGVSTYVSSTYNITNTDWKRYSWTFTYSKSSAGDTNGTGARIYIGGTANYTGTLELCGYQLEKGTKATDYSPSPEDVQHDITKASQVATDYLHYDATNGLRIYPSNASGYYTQIKSGGVSIVANNKTVASYGTTTTFYNGTNGNKAISIDSTNGIQFYKPDGTTRSGILNSSGLVIENGRIGGLTATNSWEIVAGKISSKDVNNKYVGIGLNTYAQAFFAGGTNANGSDAPFRVNHNGEVYCTNGHFKGEVTATSGTIGGCQIVNGQLIIGGANISSDFKNEDNVIKGTQTAATGTFLGKANFNDLYNGREISYWLPFAYSGTNATSYTPTNGSAATGAALKLTLKNGTVTDAIPIFYNGLTRLTSHFSVGNVIKMTYLENVVISGQTITKGYFCDATYNSNNGSYFNRTRWDNVIKAVVAITGGHIICGTASGFRHVDNGVAFNISYPILWAGSNIAVNATGSNNYTQINGVNLATSKSGWTGTTNAAVYIVGVLNGNTFTVNSAVFTTTEPTSANGLYYIPIGVMYSTTNCYYHWRGEIFAFYDGKFQNIGNGASSVVTKWAYNGNTTYISGANIYTGTVTADKIKVTDLSAFNATIGGIHIGGDSIYSGSKNAYSSANNGFYMNSAGKLDIGSSSQYIRFDGTNLNLKVKTLTIDGATPAIKADVDKIKVGGVNLVLKTGTPKTYSNIPVNDNGYAVYDAYDMVKAYKNLGLVVGESVTISFDWSATNSVQGATVRVGVNGTPYEYFGVVITFAEGSSSGHVQKSFVITSGLAAAEGAKVRFRIDNDKGGAFSISNLKLERGTIATTWSPAIEDVASDIANAAKTASNHLTYSSANGLIISQTSNTNSGYNTVMNTSGFHVRKDTTILASYGTSVIMYHNDTSHTKALEISSEGMKMYYKQSSTATTSSLGAELSASGLVVSVGKIGGWIIDSNSIYCGSKTSNTAGNAILSSVDLKRTVGTTTEREDYRLLIGANFGVTKTGAVYAQDVNIKGYIQATGGTFSGSLSAAKGTFSGTLSGVTGDFSGKITATQGTIGGFSLKSTALYSGDLIENEGSFTVSTADFSRKIGTTTRSTLRLAVGSYFGVAKDGTLYATNVNLVGRIEASSGNIGGFTIDSNSIYAGVKGSGTAAGDITLSTVNFSRNIGDTPRTLRFGIGSKFGVGQDGTVYGTGVVISGSITATGGKIGGFTIDSNSIYTGKKGTGVDDGATAISNGAITLSSANFTRKIATIDRTNLRLAIGGGFGVGSDGTIYGSSIYLNGSNIIISTSNFTQNGRSNLRLAVNNNFAVNSSGTLYATGAVINGSITATSGAIGGFTITSSKIYSGSLNGTGDGSFTLSSTSNSVSGRGDVRFSIGANFYITNTGYTYFAAGKIGDFLTVTKNGMYTKPSSVEGDSTTSNSFRISASNFSRKMSWGTEVGNLRVAIGTKFAIDKDDDIYMNVWDFRYRGTSYNPSNWALKTGASFSGNCSFTTASFSGACTFSNSVTHSANCTFTTSTHSGKVTFNGGAATSGTAELNPSATFKGDVVINGRIQYKYAAENSSSAALPIGIYTTNSKNTIMKVSSSSIRYKDVDRELNSKDIEDYYKIGVYSAKYKEGYLQEDDPLNGVYMPMFIAENVNDVFPEAVIKLNGQPENWNGRIIVPAMFAMIKSQKEQIDKLEKELELLKHRKE